MLSKSFFCQVFDKRDLKRLARAKLLQAVGEGEGIIHFIVLKDVQSTVQRDFPAVIGDDVAGMDRPGRIEFPAEVNPHGCAGLLDFGKILFLLLPSVFIFRSDQVDGDHLIPGAMLYHGFDELH